MTNRRNFLQLSGMLGVGLLSGIGSCSPSRISQRFVDKNFIDGDKLSRFPKLNVSADRVIKETVGLRPFRKRGFRIEKESLGTKTIIHNYGHGGSGWSLSWGCAHLVSQLVATTAEREVGIIGSGVSGLTTARLLQDSGYRVNIYTKALPPNVTSSKATGTWSPSFTLIDEEFINPQFVEQWTTASRFSFKAFQNFLGLNDIVTWMDEYTLIEKAEHDGPLTHGASFDHDDLVPKARLLNADEHPFDAARVYKGSSLVFNIPSYLNKHMNDFLSFGGKVTIREFQHPDELGTLSENVLINCTGLGAKALFSDEDMLPVAGQLSFLIPQPSFNYRITTENGYAIPRKDGIILGGNMLKGSWDETPNPAQTAKVIKALADTVARMKI